MSAAGLRGTARVGASDAIFFKSATEFRAWLRKHHRTHAELWVGYWKKATGKPSPTWQQSVDEALCFGWIDGLRRSRDGASYIQRFTPRKKSSNWSLVNIARVKALTAAGKMSAAGLAAFAARDPKRSGIYSFERAQAAFTPAEHKRFRAAKDAWTFWEAQPPGYRRTATHWVTSAKRPETRTKRFEILLDDSLNGLRIALLRR